MVIGMSIIVLTMTWLPLIMITSLCCVRRRVQKPTSTPASANPHGNSATSRRGSRSRRNAATDDPSGSSLMDKDRIQPKTSLTQASSQPSSGGPIAGFGQNSKLHRQTASKDNRKNNRTLDREDDKEPSAHREESAKEEKLKVEGTIIFTLDEGHTTRRNEEDDDILKSTLDSYEKPTEKRTKTQATQLTEDLALERTQESTTMKANTFRAKRSQSAPVHASPSENTIRKAAYTK